MTAVVADTPYYVLMEGNRRIGPNVFPLLAGTACSPIHGFSDKGPYDKFRANSELALTPYPLVKGFLQRQADVRDEGLKLVVIDAIGPREPLLYAVTVEAVLKAQENQSPHVTATHQLSFDREADTYRVEEASA